MSARRANAPDVRESIEAKVGMDDVEMKEANAPAALHGSGPSEDVDVDMDDEEDQDAEGDVDDNDGHDMFDTIHNLSSYLCSVEEELVTPSSFLPLAVDS